MSRWKREAIQILDLRSVFIMESSTFSSVGYAEDIFEAAFFNQLAHGKLPFAANDDTKLWVGQHKVGDTGGVISSSYTGDSPFPSDFRKAESIIVLRCRHRYANEVGLVDIEQTRKASMFTFHVNDRDLLDGILNERCYVFQTDRD